MGWWGRGLRSGDGPLDAIEQYENEIAVVAAGRVGPFALLQRMASNYTKMRYATEDILAISEKLLDADCDLRSCADFLKPYIEHAEGEAQEFDSPEIRRAILKIFEARVAGRILTDTERKMLSDESLTLLDRMVDGEIFGLTLRMTEVR